MNKLYRAAIVGVFALATQSAAAQLQIKSNEALTDVKLERQRLGPDTLVWQQPAATTGNTLRIPENVCRPGAYTLSFSSGGQPFQATVLLEKGALDITLQPTPQSGITVVFGGKDGAQNTACDNWKKQEGLFDEDYRRYEQLSGVYEKGAFREKLNGWWQGRTHSWDAYKKGITEDWKGHALSFVVSSSWGKPYAGYPAVRRQALPASLPNLSSLTYNANLIEGKDIEYLRMLFPTPARSADELTDTLLTYLPRLLDRGLGNDSLIKYWSYNLTKEAKSAGLDELQELLDTRYLAKACTADSDKDLQQRLMAYKNTRRGTKAPPIKTADFDLYESVKSDSTLVIFWASWCPHCRDELPQLYRHLAGRKGIKVVTVALDETEAPWQQAKAEFPNWQHVRAAGKWDDPNVLPYGIYATPTMFLLDKDKKVVKKYNVIGSFR